MISYSLQSMSRRRIWHVCASANSRSEKHVFNYEKIFLHVSYTLPCTSFSIDPKIRYHVPTTLLCHCWSSLHDISTEGNFFEVIPSGVFFVFRAESSTFGRMKKSVHICDDWFHCHDEDVHDITKPLWFPVVFHWTAQDINVISIPFVSWVCLLDHVNIFHQIESAKSVVRLFQYFYHTIYWKHNGSTKKTNLSSRWNEFISQWMYLDPFLDIQ